MLRLIWDKEIEGFFKLIYGILAICCITRIVLLVFAIIMFKNSETAISHGSCPTNKMMYCGFQI